MPRARALASVVAAGTIGLLAAVPAHATLVVLDDDAGSVARALRPLPDGGPGLSPWEPVYQLGTEPPVLPRHRQTTRVSASSLRGRDADTMAAALRRGVAASGAGHTVVDEVDADFGGSDADTLAEAFGRLAREPAPTPPLEPLSRRVHLYLADAGQVLTGRQWAGARLAMARSGGVWLRTTSSAAGPWTADQWLAWPTRTASVLSAGGSSVVRTHLVFGPGDPGPVWRLAQTGSACPVLASGPGARGLGPDVVSFVAGFRAVFGPPDSPTPPACAPAPALPASAAAALESAAERETTGLAIPSGGLLSPPLVAGEPAQLTVGLGADPLGLAAGAGLSPERLLTAGAIHVRADAPGAVARATVQGDGSARLAFTPRSAGPVTLTLEVDASVAGVLAGERAGTAAEVVRPLERAGSTVLLPRAVAAPGRWRLGIPLMRPGGVPGDPVLEVRPAA
jgi:hypothetical protein